MESKLEPGEEYRRGWEAGKNYAEALYKHKAKKYDEITEQQAKFIAKVITKEIKDGNTSSK